MFKEHSSLCSLNDTVGKVPDVVGDRSPRPGPARCVVIADKSQLWSGAQLLG